MHFFSQMAFIGFGKLCHHKCLAYLKRNNVCYTHNLFSRVHLHPDCVVSGRGSYFSDSLLLSSIYSYTMHAGNNR